MARRNIVERYIRADIEKLARNANATYKVGKMVLVNTQIIDRYHESCRIIENLIHRDSCIDVIR